MSISKEEVEYIVNKKFDPIWSQINNLKSSDVQKKLLHLRTRVKVLRKGGY